MRVMTQLSGVSSPFSLLGSSFMSPPVHLHSSESGWRVLASAELEFSGDSCGPCSSTVDPDPAKRFLLNQVGLLNEVMIFTSKRCRLPLVDSARGRAVNERDSSKRKSASILHASGNGITCFWGLHLDRSRADCVRRCPRNTFTWAAPYLP